MICRILLLAFIFIISLPCSAVQKGAVEYDGIAVDYLILNG